MKKFLALVAIVAASFAAYYTNYWHIATTVME